jgi:hypothetical protein
MSAAVAAFGWLVAGLGVLGVVRPAALMGLVERPWRSPAGLYLAFAIRAALGVLLVAAASSTRFPRIIGALGLVSLAAAALIPALGHARMRRFVEWWAARPAGLLRALSAGACAFGAFLVYAAL